MSADQWTVEVIPDPDLCYGSDPESSTTCVVAPANRPDAPARDFVFRVLPDGRRAYPFYPDIAQDVADELNSEES